MQAEAQLDSKTHFEGKIVSVRVDTVRLPDGRSTVREVVDHAPAVTMVPIDDDDNVILVRQYRYPVGMELLEAPAGGIEGSESPVEAAQRELREEIGFASNRLESLGPFWTTPGFCNERMYAFVARDLTPSSLEPDDDETIRVERYPLSRIPEMIRRGEIQDAKTIAALLMAICLPDQSR